MSANGPGQFGGYTPPPPPPSSKKSPWLYVGLGCGALILLSFGGCVALGFYGANKIKQIAAEKFDPVAAKASMLDTPTYPDATIDEAGTKGGRIAGMMVQRMVPAASMGLIAYDTPDPMTKVFAWYEKTLKSNGYAPAKSSQSRMDMYQKGSEIVGVQESAAGSREGKTIFVVMRFHGVKDK